jgi:hypothetical protein
MTALRARLESPGLSSNRRGASRRKLNLALETSDDIGSINVTILDLSTTGLLLETSGSLAVGESFDLHLPDAVDTRATVKWSSGCFFGCQFKEPLSTAAVSAALLRSPPPTIRTATTTEPLLVHDREDEEEEDALAEGTLSFAVKMRWILGLALLGWAAIAAIVSLAFN